MPACSTTTSGRPRRHQPALRPARPVASGPGRRPPPRSGAPRPSIRSAISTELCTSAPTSTRTRGAPCRPSRSTSQPARSSTRYRAAARPEKLAMVAPGGPADAAARRQVQQLEQPAGRHVAQRGHRGRDLAQRRVLVPRAGQPVGAEGSRQGAADDEAEEPAGAHRHQARLRGGGQLLDDLLRGGGAARAGPHRGAPSRPRCSPGRRPDGPAPSRASRACLSGDVQHRVVRRADLALLLAHGPPTLGRLRGSRPGRGPDRLGSRSRR